MSDHHKEDQWLQDISDRQRNVVFPDTVQNEARFWHNLGKGPTNTSTKVGLAILALFVSWFLAAILIATYQAHATWMVAIGMLILWGPIFGAIAWATHRTLRNIENARQRRKR